MQRRQPASRIAALAAAMLLGACAQPGTPPADAVSDEVLASPSSAGARLRPMPWRPLEVRTDCSFRDEAGYATRITLAVAQSRVETFSAVVDIPQRGRCSFHGPFVQTREKPSVRLQADDGCTVDIFEQGNAVTVGFANCAARCTRGAFDYLWPIIVDRSNGQCH
ncbi:MAG TPA: hypothetical protein PLZ11_11405 [Thauera sp.]|uniref:hypothetical protein n=1 Tax=unclassified Thauera TaxID=2609274 RepID=UPI0002CE66D6|nr:MULTISPECIES: hypothetical protein [unclassified Thauera]ENO81952.1 hypothetical protein B447_05980 [Thauera sp. 27]WBL64473.1 hypothetical protein LQF09_01225 [Thauera sp. WB-2]HNS93393.1 hypothetical protein [Thauera sp.]HRJ24541.1 hypothetical protein [Thauera sp.]